MKNAISLILLSTTLLLSNGLWAQNPQQWTARGVEAQRSKAISQGSNNTLILQVDNADRRFVEKVWADYLRSMYGAKAKKVKQSDDYVAEDTRISGVAGGQSINLYSRSEESGKGVRFSVWVDAATSGPEASYSAFDSYTGTWDLLDKFRVEVEREKVRQSLEEQEKQLQKLQRELEQLKNANQRYQNDIREAEEKIAKAKQNIVENEREQTKTTDAITQQQKVVENVRQELNKIN